MGRGRWFRMYDEVVDHPKVQRLSDGAFRAWVNLMCVAARDGGRITGNLDDLGFSLRKPRGRVEDLLDTLVRAGLVDVMGDDFRPHDWDEHQFESDQSRDRMRRLRARGRDGVVTAGVTAPESDTESESETESDSHAQDERAFAEFWKAYAPPRNAKKPDARRAWAATAKVRPPQAQLLAAVAAYRAWLGEQSAAQKRDYPMQHPATWLRGEVWNGFLAGAAAADEGDARAAWDGRAGPLVDEIGAAVFSAWFAGTSFQAGPPARIVVPGTFRRKWIADHFGAALARCYGECAVVCTNQQSDVVQP